MAFFFNHSNNEQETDRRINEKCMRNAKMTHAPFKGECEISLEFAFF